MRSRETLPGSSLSCRPPSWKRRQLQASGHCDHLSRKHSFLPACPSCHALLPRPWRGPVSGWEGPKDKSAVRALPKGHPVVPTRGPNQGPVCHTPRATQAVRSLGSCPPVAPTVGRRHPQLEGGEIVPQTHWVTQLVRNQGTRLRLWPSSSRPTPSHDGGALPIPPSGPVPPTALFPSLWWFLTPACWFQLGLGWGRQPACSLHFVVWPLCYQRLWDFSGAGVEKNLLQSGPRAWPGIRKEAGSQTLIMLRLVYVQWPEAEMLEAHWLQAGHVLFSTFEASGCSGKSARDQESANRQ